MKFEIQITDDDLRKDVEIIAGEAVRRYLLGEHGRVTAAGRRVCEQAQLKAAEFIASGDVRALVADAAREEFANVVKELTTAELRRAVRAELKAMRERGQLELE
jgi:hypothetical protein